MTLLDWAIIALYFVFATGIGVAMSRRAGSSITEFFIGGRSLPWWLAGTSMVATTFAVDTPLAETVGLLGEPIDGGPLNWTNWVAGVVSVYATLFGVGQLIFGATSRGVLMLFVAVVCFWWIGRNLRPSRTSMGPVPGVAS